MRVGEGLETFGAMKMLYNVMIVGLGVKRKFYKVVVATVIYGAETLGMRIRIDERREPDVMNWLVIVPDRWRNEEVRRSSVIKEKTRC